jgi:hypothetical protein
MPFLRSIPAKQMIINDRSICERKYLLTIVILGR